MERCIRTGSAIRAILDVMNMASLGSGSTTIEIFQLCYLLADFLFASEYYVYVI